VSIFVRILTPDFSMASVMEFGDSREALVRRILKAKDTSGLTYDAIGTELGVTNAYAAQILLNQSQLHPGTGQKLQAIFERSGCPLTTHDTLRMQECPTRVWSDDLMKEPLVYRLVEACQSFGDSVRHVVHEKFGDGVMSAIDVYVTVEKAVGAFGEPRVILTFNGKYLPHVEQKSGLANSRTPPGHEAKFGPPHAPPPPPNPIPLELPSSYQCPPVAVALRGPEKEAFVADLHRIKAAAGLTFDQLANELGVTNVYAAQLINNQAQLQEPTAKRLVEMLPALTPQHVRIMRLPPVRTFNPDLAHEPLVYRMIEACQHYRLAIKAIVNEHYGDGIMSAIDFYLSVRRAKGPHGEARVVLTFNGKFLPHVEQLTHNLEAMEYE